MCLPLHVDITIVRNRGILLTMAASVSVESNDAIDIRQVYDVLCEHELAACMSAFAEDAACQAWDVVSVI